MNDLRRHTGSLPLDFTITDASSAQFKVRHMMIANVKGEFTKVSGTVQTDEADPSATRNYGGTSFGMMLPVACSGSIRYRRLFPTT